ncbi:MULTISPECIES: hypothetical protein [unclassified Rhizobium]|uniref:hypothetical protein n=1 Tax=unclassified Rhizobium TaxID=2613769 RepID=UPI0007145742|nr:MULTISPECIES: hypothetical protein [unclassified Rhizobium]KQS86662.1 hypothetical protein ASG50_28445 [Rhizobium sp. Leaf386]KQS94083.1 hypothetical protein ASG42_30425 [Rhizobium sp. Leaf391]KQT99304.1 hypothetical protein ASG68_29840 [Rhizobium sp. Leaf453]
MNAFGSNEILMCGLLGGLIGFLIFSSYCRRKGLKTQSDMLKVGMDNTAAVEQNTAAMREHSELLREYLKMQKPEEK